MLAGLMCMIYGTLELRFGIFFSILCSQQSRLT